MKISTYTDIDINDSDRLGLSLLYMFSDCPYLLKRVTYLKCKFTQNPVNKHH